MLLQTSRRERIKGRRNSDDTSSKETKETPLISPRKRQERTRDCRSLMEGTRDCRRAPRHDAPECGLAQLAQLGTNTSLGRCHRRRGNSTKPHASRDRAAHQGCCFLLCTPYSRLPPTGQEYTVLGRNQKSGPTAKSIPIKPFAPNPLRGPPGFATPVFIATPTSSTTPILTESLLSSLSKTPSAHPPPWISVSSRRRICP